MFGKKKGAGGSAVLYASKKKKFSERLRFSFSHHYELYLLALPTLIYVFIFCYIPIYGLQMAFQNFSIAKGFGESEWVGLSIL